MKYGIILLLASSTAFGAQLDLNSYMDQVTQKHRGIESYRQAKEASADSAIAADIDLIPILDLKGLYLSDKSQPNQLGGNEMRSREYDLSLAKKFTTGTNVRLFGRTGEYDDIGVNIPFPSFDALGQYSTSTVGIEITQSLWKGYFGHDIWLREQRVASQARADMAGSDAGLLQTVNSAEATYWDYLYAVEERRIRQDSIDRSSKIENWFHRRVSDGISDKADLLSAESLTAARKLKLIMTEDNLNNLQKKMHDDLELPAGAPLPQITGDLGQKRDLRHMVSGEGNKIVSLDSWVAIQRAKATAFQAQEAAEAVKADLTLTGRYANNGYTPGGYIENSSQGLGGGKYPTTYVQLEWIYKFDDDIKRASKSSAAKAAISADLISQRKAQESETSWSEINRMYDVLSREIDAAQNLQKIQAERAKAESGKLSRGRAITSDVLNAEEDAASAALQLAQLQVAQRKLEAQARLFIAVKDNE